MTSITLTVGNLIEVCEFIGVDVLDVSRCSEGCDEV